MTVSVYGKQRMRRPACGIRRPNATQGGSTILRRYIRCKKEELLLTQQPTITHRTRPWEHESKIRFIKTFLGKSR